MRILKTDVLPFLRVTLTSVFNSVCFCSYVVLCCAKHIGAPSSTNCAAGTDRIM